VIVVAMVCVGIAAALLVSVLRIAIADRRALHTEASRVQTAWLVESGVERAAARLSADPDYSGEVWKVSAEDLGAAHGGAVSIEVESLDGQPDHRLVRVRADYPDEPRLRVRSSTQVTIRTGTSP
jgi:hypothetical protein